MLNSAFDIIEEIHNMGFEAFLVGGAVRSLLLDDEIHDCDICTNAPIEALEKKWNTHDIGQSRDFGIVTVTHNGIAFEIAQMRTETTSIDGRHPDSVEFVSTIEEDLSRRDFSFNSLAMDVDGNIIDLFGGREALAKGLVITVGNPTERFEDDFLRIIRAVRFSARLGFHIECETEKAIMEGVHNLPKLSAERIKDELFKMSALGGKKFAHAIETMNALGILDVILPEVAGLFNFKETERFHPEAHAFANGSVFGHTMQALRSSRSNDALVNIAVLFHDLGKLVTHRFDADTNKETFHGHDMAAIPLIERISKRLKFSIEEKEACLFAATKHMLLMNRGMKPTKIVALVTNTNWELLKKVSRADDSSRLHLWDEESFDSNIKFFEEVATKWTTDSKPTKIVSGNLVMEMLSLKPSRAVGDIVRRITELVVDEGRTDPVEALVMEVWAEMNV